MTKAYTLTSLITEVSNIRYSADQNAVVGILSPRAGESSAKFVAIDNFLNGYLNEVLEGTASGVKGVSARTRLLNALRIRKTQGQF